MPMLLKLSPFQSLPVVVFFSSIISIMYHWGVMQRLIRFLATLMQLTMGTTALESLASVSNIFVSYVSSRISMVDWTLEVNIGDYKYS